MRKQVKQTSALLFGILSISLNLFASADGRCVVTNCGFQIIGCGIEKECRQWLRCVKNCNDDAMKCPSVCGFYYQSKKINKVSQCVFKNHCTSLAFEEFPPFETNKQKWESMTNTEGTYWFAASHGGPHIFDYGCQKFQFLTTSHKAVQVEYSVPLTLNNETRIKQSIGIFSSNSDSSTKVEYDNFTGYHEKWYVSQKTKNTITADVCFAGKKYCHRYGTIILSRISLKELPFAELTSLQSSLMENQTLSLNQMQRSKVAGCTN